MRGPILTLLVYFACIVEQCNRYKDALVFCYQTNKSFIIGNIKFLPPKYDFLRRIFRVSIAPKVGDLSVIRSIMIDLLVYAHEKARIDVLDFMFEEMRSCVFKRKSSVYASFIQALIEKNMPQSYIHCLHTKSCESFNLPTVKDDKKKKKGRNPSMEDRATLTPRVASTTNVPPVKTPQWIRRKEHVHPWIQQSFQHVQNYPCERSSEF